MTNEEAEVLRNMLSQHYGDQVVTVREFCDVLRRWTEVAGDYLVSQGYLDNKANIETLFLATAKSSLLGRMIYGKEKLRTVKCPECKGTWRGCFQDCPCGGCGWLPNEENK